MTFKAPSFLVYIFSLIIAGLLAGLAYVVFQSQGLTDGATLLAVGLIIGHLVGVFAAPSTKTVRSPSPTNTSTETVSLYVGNLAYSARRDALRDLFAQYGNVSTVRIMTDRETRRPRGYGFVEMDSQGAQSAIKNLDGTEFLGRTLRVNEAKQRTE